MQRVGLRDPIEGLAKGVLQRIDRSEFAPAEFVLDFREDLFDRIEVGTVGRQEEHAGISGLHRFDHAAHFVRLQVVEDEDVARAELRGQFLLNVFQEEFAIEGTVDNHRGEEPVEAEGSNEGGGFPVAVGHEIEYPLIGRPPAVEAGHRGVAEGFVEENEATGIDPRREDFPEGAVGDDIGPVLLGGMDRLFFRLSFSSWRAFHRLEMEVFRFSSRLRSSSVVPGLALI
jgi:hypothetical protein